MINAVNEFLEDMRGGRMEESPIVTVEQGRLQGRLVESSAGKHYYSFQGIPYAKPPLGSLRFKAPKPADAWEGTRDATAEGNECAQIDPLIHKGYVGDENCLFLNVYTPNIDGEFLPVMVFIHGGRFKFGSGSSILYGPEYLVEKDVVIVTINYRVGPLGFLGLNTPEVPGNAGLKDIVQALRWVKENIGQFGGNSGNLTVFGSSAGSMSTSILTASSMSKGLINKAIIQSGTAVSSRVFQKHPVDNAKSLAKILGCESDDADEILEFLTTTPVKDLVEASEKIEPDNVFNKKGGIVFSPVIEKEFPDVEAILTESYLELLTSGRIAQIPTMIGSNGLEFTLERFTDDLQVFIPEELNIEVNTKESVAIADEIKRLYFTGSHTSVESLHEYFELISDILVNIDTYRHVHYLIKATNKPIYLYKFDYVGELNLTKKQLDSLGLKHPGHTDELGYLFKSTILRDVQPTPQDVKTRERMLRLWTNFAKSGNPTPDENHYLTVTWQPVTSDNVYYLQIGSELALGSNPSKEKMQFWQDLYAKYYKSWNNPSSNLDDIPAKVITPIFDQSVIETVDAVTKEDDIKEEIVASIEEHKEMIVDALIQETEELKEKEEEAIQQIEEHKEIIVDALIKETEELKEKEEEAIQQIEVVLGVPKEIVEEMQQMVEPADIIDKMAEVLENSPITEDKPAINGNGIDKVKPRTSNEIKMVQSNGHPIDVIRANDPPEDDLPKNIGVRSKFVNFFESLGSKK